MVVAIMLIVTAAQAQSQKPTRTEQDTKGVVAPASDVPASTTQEVVAKPENPSGSDIVLSPEKLEALRLQQEAAARIEAGTATPADYELVPVRPSVPEAVIDGPPAVNE